uniref:Uncharacterized protein n=1 Tax=Thermomicrobium roseum TaxID=500 RepID=A0A7C5VX57_THERO
MQREPCRSRSTEEKIFVQTVHLASDRYSTNPVQETSQSTMRRHFMAQNITVPTGRATVHHYEPDTHASTVILRQLYTAKHRESERVPLQV